ncbi:hypothetical protein VSO92_12430 [Myroides pelagicus]|uniref:HYC_CC_PP family protein n=1 Tax=Myroides pelagicus TaxID=270914 RepID=UPI002DB8D27E|nr:hypothetical protein [Myroides pelagicus]MEC4114909.1 hypothetical protein [Myroides pelagicus]
MRITLALTMKALFSIIFSLFLIGVSSGYTTYQHICKGTLQQTALASSLQEQTGCGFCEKNGTTVDNSKTDCCKEKVVLVKVGDEVQQSTPFILKLSFFTEVILHRYFGSVFDLTISLTPVLNKAYFTYLYDLIEVPIYIKHCVYRI